MMLLVEPPKKIFVTLLIFFSPVVGVLNYTDVCAPRLGVSKKFSFFNCLPYSRYFCVCYRNGRPDASPRKRTCRRDRRSIATACAGASLSAGVEICLDFREMDIPTATLPDTSSVLASISEIPTKFQMSSGYRSLLCRASSVFQIKRYIHKMTLVIDSAHLQNTSDTSLLPQQ